MRTVTALLLVTTCVAFAGFTFGVNPIGVMPESYLGYRIGPVVPQLSVSYGNFSGNFEYRDVDYGEEYSGKGSISAIAPSLGVKLMLGSSDLKPFARVSAGMPFFSAKVDVDLESEEDEQGVEDFVDDAMDGLRQSWIFTGGAGIEYFFADQFSLGGEFKYRMFTAGGEWEIYEDEFLNLSGSIGGTSAGLWLNYYF